VADKFVIKKQLHTIQIGVFFYPQIIALDFLVILIIFLTGQVIR